MLHGIFLVRYALSTYRTFHFHSFGSLCLGSCAASYNPCSSNRCYHGISWQHTNQTLRIWFYVVVLCTVFVRSSVVAWCCCSMCSGFVTAVVEVAVNLQCSNWLQTALATILHHSCTCEPFLKYWFTKNDFDSVLEFYSLLNSHGLLPFIVQPTRVVDSQTPSLIDNIFSTEIILPYAGCDITQANLLLVSFSRSFVSS